MMQADYIREDHLLEALRDGWVFSHLYERLHGKPDTLPGKHRRKAQAREIARWISGHPEEPTTGGELVSDLLQAYTDEWLATGIETDTGIELPFSRKLTRTNHAQHAVQQYERTGRASNIDWDNGLERHPKPLHERLSADMPEDAAKAANLWAAGIFHAFMEAPWRYRLGKCKRCHRYFVLKIQPSKKPYKRGMHCPECKSPASAKASGMTKRGAREELLMGLALDVWPLWRPEPRFGPRNEWVAKRVCDALGETRAIQQNWVTRHEKQIVAEAKRIAGAKHR